MIAIHVKPLSLDKINIFTNSEKDSILRKYGVKNYSDLEWVGYTPDGNMVFHKSQAIKNKAIQYQQNLKKAEQKKAEQFLNNPATRSQYERLLSVAIVHNNLSNEFLSETDPAKKLEIRKIVGGISFVANEIFSSLKKWWKPLSEKQLACLEKAEAAIKEAGL